MRAGIVAFLHESNTFSRSYTTLEDFRSDVWCEGEAIRDTFCSAPHEVGGFFEGLERAGIEAFPLFAARAHPGGPIAREAFAAIVEKVRHAYECAPELDGLLVALHGAAAAEDVEDADGCVLELLRGLLGPDRPLVTTLDPHANLSRAMAAAADALVPYRTNPHLDQRERGVEAAEILARALKSGEKPVCAAFFPPLLIPIEHQDPETPPLQEIWRLASKLRRRAGIISADVVLGFPYADTRDLGCAAVAVAHSRRAAAGAARALARRLWASREAFLPSLPSLEEALEKAGSLAPPILLLDTGDNVGAGAAGDSTPLIAAVEKRGLVPAVAVVWDPDAVRAARRAGLGARLRLAIGGKAGPLSGRPLIREVEVLRLGDGRFEEMEPRHGGYRVFDQGPTAVVRTPGGLTFLLTSRRTAPFSLAQLTSAGIEPHSYRTLIAKGVHAPIAAYRPVARSILRAGSPGPTPADPRRLEFANRRAPLFPFERNCSWDADP